MSQNPSYLRHRGLYTRATTQCRPPSPVCEIADGGEWCAPEWRHISNPITLTPNSKRAATSGQTGHRWQPQRRPRQLKSTTGHQVGCGRCDTRRRLTVAHLHAHRHAAAHQTLSNTHLSTSTLAPRSYQPARDRRAWHGVSGGWREMSAHSRGAHIPSMVG